MNMNNTFDSFFPLKNTKNTKITKFRYHRLNSKNTKPVFSIGYPGQPAARP